LNGDTAPRAKQVRYRMLPPGRYTISVILFGTDGERGAVIRNIEVW
jgi:hypothetical protein